jgi:3-phenylpropionate/cinnamic acid dioxygenase small subunit
VDYLAENDSGSVSGYLHPRGPNSVVITDRSTAALVESYAFLVLEAELLDNNEMQAWFGLLDADISYEMPVRITRERSAGLGFSDQGFHMREEWHSLQTRVARLDSEYAWAEDPPSRTRRFVTNVRASETDVEGEVAVKSNVLVYRARFDNPAHQLLSAERHDVLRRNEGELKLLKRVVLLDHTTLGTPNLAIIL